MKTNANCIGRKYLTGALALALALGPLSEPAYAATTVLSDLPIASKVTAKPNIMYTLDDSGSMVNNYIPDFVQSNTPLSGWAYCRSGFYTGANWGLAQCNGVGSPWNFPPFLDADFNHMYYNPNVTYTAPKKYDGTSYIDQNAANTTNWTLVQSDPFLTPAAKSSIVAKVAVPVYCNSDWPLVGTTYVTGDVGDANGENDSAVHNSQWAVAGEHCRINGNDYNAIGAAPAISADYNYPWQPSVTPPNAKYFYRQGGTRTLWCDATAPGWPRNLASAACTFTCTVGVPTGGSTTAQTCTDGGVQKQCCVSGPPVPPNGNPSGCAAASTYTPAGCNTSSNPEYCAPGIGLPGECVGGCGCNTRRTGEKGTCNLSGANCGCTDNPAGTACALASCPDYVTNPTGCTLGGQLVPTCPAAPSATCSNFVWDPVNSVYTTTTLLQDAELLNGGTGAVCRHNNFDYTGIGGPASSPVNYTTLPLNAKYKTTVAGAGCTTFSGTINIPRHYYTVASIQYCSAKNTTANAQWAGFGVAPCQSKNDFTTYKYVSYGTFTRVNLINDGRTFSFVDPYTSLPGTRTYAQEMTNYANWVSYYRTRVLAAKTTTAIAFNFLDATYRVGFHTMNTPSTNYVDVNDWLPGVGNQRQTWYTKLFGVTIGVGLTPTLNSLLRVGELFRTGKGGQGILLPATTFPEGYIPAAALDPITVSCQKNYHILFTDGFTNQFALPTIVGEVDAGNVPVFPPDPDPFSAGPPIHLGHPEITLSGLRPLAGLPWPDPYKDPIPQANSLADIALYYWQNDLRTTPTWPLSIANDNVPSNDGRLNADLLWENDPAWWQHVNFSAISFGSEGILDASNAKAVADSIATGATKWFVAPNFLTPGPNSPTVPAGSKGATAVDDLWHATVNSRGTFVYAKDPLQVSYGLGHILAGIQNQTKSRAASAFSSSVLTLTNHSIFEPSIQPGWAGDLRKVEIDPFTGAQGLPDWDALTILNTLLATPAIPPASDNLYPWFASRRIATWNAGPVPFLYGNLSAAQLATLGGSAAVQQNVIAYLRGGSVSGAPTPRSIEGTNIGDFRQRFGKLGDISDSGPLVVGPPSSPWTDADDPGYSAYVTAQAGRATRVYVGANDGMLHVFDANTGDEDFAYIPSALFTNAVDQDGAPKGIQALTYQDGGAPIFKHHFYVNSSPRTADVDFNNTGGAGGSGDWHTIVVGGLGKGGGSYYAIDATVPVNTTDTEAAAAAHVLWEFTAPDMQFSHSRPIIAKTRADGWVVIVANGYDTVSGKGKIYMINPKTGALIRTLTTTAADPGTPASPSGLAQISGFTQDFHNQIVEQIYGGDLNGNFWRWDVSDPLPANWTTVLFAQLKAPPGDPSTVIPQPVTTAPQVEIDLSNGNDRWVFVGTGRLLDNADLLTPSPGVIAPSTVPEQIETFYAIRDGTLTTPSVAGLPIQPRATLRVANAATTGPLVGGVPNGWYMDLPLGQRVVVDPEADLNVVTFIATATQPDPCLTSLPAYIYAREYTTAESDIQVGGVTVNAAYSDQGAVGLELVALLSASSSFPVLGIAITQETNAGITPYNLQPKSFGGSHRMSWRMLGN